MNIHVQARCGHRFMYLCYTGTCAYRTHGPAHTYVFFPSVRPSIHPCMHPRASIPSHPSINPIHACMACTYTFTCACTCVDAHSGSLARMHARHHASTQARKHASTHARKLASTQAASTPARKRGRPPPRTHTRTQARTEARTHARTQTHTQFQNVAFEGWSLDAHAVSLSWEP